jgi:hypothetical protein
LTARDPRSVRVSVGSAERSIARAQIASVALAEGTAAAPVTSPAKFREFMVPEGTVLSARLESSIGSDTSHAEDAVEVTLTEAVRADGVEVWPEGSLVKGVVVVATPSGKVRGRADLLVKFRSLLVHATGETYPVTATLHHVAPSNTGDDAKKIGIPAAGGAVLGAIVGGKQGAGIGAVIGGGAGTAVVLSTSGTEIHLKPGALVALALEHAVIVQMPIER